MTLLIAFLAAVATYLLINGLSGRRPPPRPPRTTAHRRPGLDVRLRQAGVSIVPVPRRPDGIDLDALDAACTQHRPRLLFIQSVLHNPTGWGRTAANLHRVLMLAQRHLFGRAALVGEPA